MSVSNRNYLFLVVIIIVFVVQCIYFNFTQDDAFISFRYVKNFTQGNGLVFNSGERVEGYTNFLWIIVLSIFSELGLNIIVISKILGVASGCISLFLLYEIANLFFSKQDSIYSLVPPLLLTASSAFAYWSISGLETSFFVAAVLFSVYLYLIHSRLWTVTCAVSTLIRPEGALIFGILFPHKLFLEKAPLRRSLFNLIVFILLLLPFLIFKLFYYGNILPNPFYAKTGFSWEYIVSGLGYFWLFLRQYGLWGVLYLLPLLLYKGLDTQGKLLVWLVYIYSIYVIVIGGDVLRVHRFFLPVLPLLFLLFVVFLHKLRIKLRNMFLRHMVFVTVVLSISAIFFLVPRPWIRIVRADEKHLVEKMQQIAEYANVYYQPTLSIAVTTIGSISYYLGTGDQVIDMLGLTDIYISKHPEKFEGITVNWKEKRYNTSYLLSRDPDYILFATGFKPSAPAEKALFLNSKFRQNYNVIPMILKEKELVPIFKKKGTYLKKNDIFQDTRFIDLFSEGARLHMRGKHAEAIEKLKQAALVGPQDFALIYEIIGRSYYLMQDYVNAETYLKKAIQIDECSIMAHTYLANIYQNRGQTEESETEKKKVTLCDPNFAW
jgi:hypothetical protein